MFYFLKLPRELRDSVYRVALTTDVIRPCARPCVHPRTRPCIRSLKLPYLTTSDMTSNPNGVLFVSHQIYDEATQILYADGHFLFEISPDKIDFLNTRQHQIHKLNRRIASENQEVGLGCIIEHGINVKMIRHLAVEINWQSIPDLDHASDEMTRRKLYFMIIKLLRQLMAVFFLVPEFPGLRSLTITWSQWPIEPHRPTIYFTVAFLLLLMFNDINPKKDELIKIIIQPGLREEERGQSLEIGLESPLKEYLKELQSAVAEDLRLGKFDRSDFLRLASKVINVSL